MLVKSRKHFCTSATVIALIITNIMYLYQEFNSGTPQGSNLDQGLDCIVINAFSDTEHAGESALTKPKHWWRVKGSMLPSKNYTQLTACQWKIYRSTAGG